MDEVNLSPLAPQSDEATVQTAFDKLKGADASEQEIGCKFIGKHFGADAEATLRAMLAKAKPKAAPLIPPHRPFRRDLKSSAAVVETLKRSAVSEPKPEAKATPEPKAIDAPAPNPPAGVLVDMDAPYEVARRFVLDRFHLNGIPTLRWWKAEWREWTGTHYAAMEEDALRAEIYQFLAKANYGKFDPAPKHVNAVVDAIKGLGACCLPNAKSVRGLAKALHLGAMSRPSVARMECFD